MAFKDDVRKIAREKANKSGIGIAEVLPQILGVSKDVTGLEKSSSPVVLASPITFEALTYDATKDVTFTDDAGIVQVFKTVATAKLTDANGVVTNIDTVIFN